MFHVSHVDTKFVLQQNKTIWKMKSTIFWDVIPCNLVYRHFGRMYCLHHHGWSVSHASNQKAGFWPWRWRQYSPPKYLLTSIRQSCHIPEESTVHIHHCKNLRLNFRHQFTGETVVWLMDYVCILPLFAFQKTVTWRFKFQHFTFLLIYLWFICQCCKYLRLYSIESRMISEGRIVKDV
jgi:hypothetical protein